MNEIESRPYFCSFSPDVIPYQRLVIDEIECFDYSTGNLEILLSGSMGSAKSILMAHLAVRHCLEFKGACVAICRRGLPDLKKTIWAEINDHMSEDFEEGYHYRLNRAEMVKTFKNGSKIICCTWADKRYKKFRSLKLSMLVIEEIVENDEEDEEAFKQLKARLRRIPHIPQNILIAATNPDAPGHWVHRYFIAQSYPNRKVFYSKTEDNPFLDKIYTQQLRRDMSINEAKRYLDGEWVEISGEVIYSEYKRERNFKDTEYQIDKRYPIGISWDFNIGEGKPMSSVLFQYIKDQFHFFDEVIISGARTQDTISEIDDRKLFFSDAKYIVCGDAAGKHKDTRSSKSDYDIIKEELDKRNISYDYQVPLSNPAIRSRHNRVNAYCLNGLNEVRLFVYRKCKTLDLGFRLVKLKKGSYIEDDSKEYQHVTTAAGYAIMKLSEPKPIQRSMRL